MKELIAIQAELKAPKGQTNKFGGYKYRNCEDILEAVKPLLRKHNAALTLTDDIIRASCRLRFCAASPRKKRHGRQPDHRGSVQLCQEIRIERPVLHR